MIFVTVGMHTKNFDRLLAKMDEIAGKLSEEVVMQIGHTDFRPKNARCFDFTTEAGIKENCRKARIVVTQPAMSILDAIEQGTPVIVVPRLKKYAEVIDDHQLDFARQLEKEDKVIAVYDVDKLEEVLSNADFRPPELEKGKRLVNALKEYIAQFAKS